MRAGGEESGEVGCRVDQVLEVVEEEKQRACRRCARRARPWRRAPAQPPPARAPGPEAGQAAPTRHRAGTGRTKGRRLRRETRLSRAARPGQSEQADVLTREQPEHLAQLALAAQEGRGRDRQIRLVETLEWREVVFSELVDALGRRQVLQPVLAEVAQLVCAEEGSA